jgi:hypothetical protein
MQRQVKRQPDFTLALSDVISMPALPAYSHDAKQLGTIKMILNVPRPGGSAGTLVLLPAVLSFVCGCSKDRVNRGPRAYAHRVVLGLGSGWDDENSEDVIGCVRVLIKGLPEASDYIFLEEAATLLMYYHKKDPAAASERFRWLSQTVADHAMPSAEDEDEGIELGGTAPAVAKRVAEWFRGLTHWRSVLRAWLNVLTAERAEMAHAWLLGLKAERSTPAAQLAELMRTGPKAVAAKARETLRSRARAALRLLAEKFALSPRAKQLQDQRAATTRLLAQVAEEAEVDALKRLQQQRAQAEWQDESEDDGSEPDSLLVDAGRSEDELSPDERKQIKAAVKAAVAAKRRELAQQQWRAQVGACAQAVDAATASGQSTDPWSDEVLIQQLFQDDDPGMHALLVEMFGREPDTLLKVCHSAARTEMELSVQYVIQQRFEPKAVRATLQTQLMADIGVRYTDTALTAAWKEPAAELGFNIWARGHKVAELYQAEKRKHDMQPTPKDSPDGCPLLWANLATAGMAFSPQEVLQQYVNIPTVDMLVDVDDSNDSDMIWLVILIDGRSDQRNLMRTLGSVKIMNLHNVALAVTSALTIYLANGNDHADSLPHAWRLRHFVDQVLQGQLMLKVRGKPRRLGILTALDGAARAELSLHSSALANRPFNDSGFTKEQGQELDLLLPVTHTAKSQQDMHDRTIAVWLRDNEGAVAPPKAKVDDWARKYEGIHGANPFNLDMRYWFPGYLS